MLKSITTTAAILFATLAVGTAAKAQDNQQRVQTQQYQIDPSLNPNSGYHGPKLGVQAFGNGQYVEVTRAFFGSAAARLGLEPGDRILQINGRPVRSIAELQQMLQGSVYTHNGQIRVLIDNVRARHGHWGAQRYVSANTYLDGYAHLAGTTPGPIYTQPGTPGPVYTQPVITSGN